MFKEYMQNLKDETLFNAFEELQDMQSTGVLKSDAVARGLIGIYKDYYHRADVSISVIENAVCQEMARRYYTLKSR